MTSLFQRAVDTHQHRLSVRTTIAAVRVAVLANDHRGTNGPFGMIVLERHAGFVQKREQVLPMSPQTFDQPTSIRVLPVRLDQTLKSQTQTASFRSILGLWDALAFPKTDRVPQQATQFLGKHRPILVSTAIVLDILQVAKQMHQAGLPLTTTHGVVRPPKIADQGAGKNFAEKLQQRWAAPRAVDQVVSQLLGGERRDGWPFALASGDASKPVVSDKLASYPKGWKVPKPIQLEPVATAWPIATKQRRPPLLLGERFGEPALRSKTGQSRQYPRMVR